MPAAVRLLVLDVHGVVLNNPLPRFLQELEETTGQANGTISRRWLGLRQRAWTGAISDSELWEALAGPGGDEAFWRQRLENCYRPGPAAHLLEGWQQRVPVWLLSNHRSTWLIPRLLRLGMSHHFAKVLVSDDLGAVKPEPEAFAPVLAAVDDPQTVVYIDDKDINVDAARRLGLHAILADPRGAWTDAVDELIAGGMP